MFTMMEGTRVTFTSCLHHVYIESRLHHDSIQEVGNKELLLYVPLASPNPYYSRDRLFESGLNLTNGSVFLKYY